MKFLISLIFVVFNLATQGQVLKLIAGTKYPVGYQAPPPAPGPPDYVAIYTSGDSANGFGNSIMIGIGSTPGSSTDWNTYSSGYMHKIRDTFGVIVNNYALSGMGVKPMVTEFYRYGDSTNSDDHLILAGGYNDLRHRGGEADTLVPNQIYQGYNAAIANQFLKSWIVAGAATLTGSWTNFNANMNGKGKSYYSLNASYEGLQSSHGTSYFDPPTASYTATGRYFVVGYVASDGSPTYEKNSFHVDTNGVLYATVNPNYQTSGAGPAWDVPQYEMPAAFVVDAGRVASHTIRVRPVTEGKVSLFDYFGVLNDTDAVKSVVIMEIPKQTPSGYVIDPAFDNANDSVIMKGIYKQRQVASEWRTRGYPVARAQINDYFNPATMMNADLIHPDNTGQLYFFKGFQSVVDSGTAVPDTVEVRIDFRLSGTSSGTTGWVTAAGDPDVSVITLTNMNDKNGAATTWDMTTISTSNWAGFSGSSANNAVTGVTGGNYFAGASAGVYQSIWFQYGSSSPATFNSSLPQIRFSGLNPAKTYRIYFAATDGDLNGFDNNPSRFTVVGLTTPASVDLDGNNNNNVTTGNYIQFQCKADGTADFFINSVTPGSDLGTCPGIILKEF